MKFGKLKTHENLGLYGIRTMYVFVIWTLHVIKCILLAPFSEVVNQSNKKKTPEGPSFAAAPVSLLTAESSTMPVEHIYKGGARMSYQSGGD